MVNLAAPASEDTLLRRLGLPSAHTEKLSPVGTVAFPQARVQVEAGAIKVAYEGTVTTPAGEYRTAPDWRSLWRLTVTRDRDPHPVVITAATRFTRCWALAEMLATGHPVDEVIRAAALWLASGDIEISQAPGTVSALASGAALGQAHVVRPAGVFPPASYVLPVTGDSMAGGLLVVIDPEQVPGDGDIAVITLDWEDQDDGLHRTRRMLKRLGAGETLPGSCEPGRPPVPVPPGGRARVEGRVIASLTADGDTTIVTPCTGEAPYRIPRVRLG